MGTFLHNRYIFIWLVLFVCPSFGRSQHSLLVTRKAQTSRFLFFTHSLSEVPIQCAIEQIKNVCIGMHGCKDNHYFGNGKEKAQKNFETGRGASAEIADKKPVPFCQNPVPFEKNPPPFEKNPPSFEKKEPPFENSWPGNIYFRFCLMTNVSPIYCKSHYLGSTSHTSLT